MRILILNWRDLKNPRAGGAEVFTHEIARRLVAGGDRVEWFSAAFPGSVSEEESDGVDIVRGGHQWSVHWQAFQRYRGELRAHFDVVLDEVNTVPFFTPLWADIPAFMLIYQLARQVWWYESPFPINALGFVAEPIYLQCYRHTPVLTLSRSTEQDLRRFGLSGPVTIVPPAIQAGYIEPGQKALEPTFLYVGRLAASKRIDHIVKAFHRFKQETHRGRLWLIGEGDDHLMKRLRALVRELDVVDDVSFLGRVSLEEKYQRMAQADLLLMASVREGWGLAVSEANACGTPALVYDVPGLRDAVRHEQTGLVVPPSPVNLADGMIRLMRDERLRSSLAAAALQWGRSLSLDASATVVRSAITASAGPGGHFEIPSSATHRAADSDGSSRGEASRGW